MHHRNEDGFIGDSPFDIAGVNQAILIYREIGYPESLSPQKPACLYHRVVLDGGSNQVVPLILVGESYTLYGKVIRFGPSTRKDDFVIPGTDELRNLNPRLLYSFFCLLAIGIGARRVAKSIGEVW